MADCPLIALRQSEIDDMGLGTFQRIKGFQKGDALTYPHIPYRSNLRRFYENPDSLRTPDVRPNLCAKRLAAKFVLRSCEIELHGKCEALSAVTDELVINHMRASIELAKRDCEVALAKYNALLPVGERRVWRVAAA